MSDPQHSIVSVLKPQSGFDHWYQGVPVTTPIQLFPWVDSQPRVLDGAGQATNYDPLLSKYLPVPLGSTVMLWLPRCVQQLNNVLVETSYRYQIRWRIRGITDQINGRSKVYSMHGQVPGAITTISAPFDPDINVPAAVGSVIIPALPANSNVALSLDHTGKGLADSQGYTDNLALPAFPVATRGVNYYPPELVPALGDEIGIFVSRAAGTSANWDFAGVDFGFNLFYGVGSTDSDAAANGIHPQRANNGVIISTLSRSTYP